MPHHAMPNNAMQYHPVSCKSMWNHRIERKIGIGVNQRGALAELEQGVASKFQPVPITSNVEERGKLRIARRAKWIELHSRCFTVQRLHPSRRLLCKLCFLPTIGGGGGSDEIYRQSSSWDSCKSVSCYKKVWAATKKVWGAAAAVFFIAAEKQQRRLQSLAAAADKERAANSPVSQSGEEKYLEKNLFYEELPFWNTHNSLFLASPNQTWDSIEITSNWNWNQSKLIFCSLLFIKAQQNSAKRHSCSPKTKTSLFSICLAKLAQSWHKVGIQMAHRHRHRWHI